MSTPATMPPVGARAEFRKTVGETDVTLFAGLTGDFAPQHIDDEYMRSRPQGRRIAHGALTLSLTSTAAARLCADHRVTALSYGYDRVRFLAPVFLGQTVAVDYVVERIETEKNVVHCAMTVTTDDGRLCLVGTHLLYCYPEEDAP
ncbi:MaoC family dehydratase [Bogoriella caseilytica]|uniref:Acyl dehydratase n=1 Tax=Bogoriella caseilytica TaxID=56055 RepID=A0A3N2BDQ3_9MICO|nr:MaoC/PaaZ C-terminal domain-containing protein [Bogoriella caseilytica]ROR73164.1 acyl dehydratase [Bogoriella caseilytica]